MSKETAEQAVEKLEEDMETDAGDGNIEVVEGETIRIEPDKDEKKDEETEEEVAADEETDASADDDTEATDDDDDDSGSEEEDDSDAEADEETPSFPDELLDAAHLAGMTIAEAKAAGSPRALKTLLDVLARNSKDEKKDEKKDDAPEFKLDLGEDVDETLSGGIAKLHEHYQGELKKRDDRQDRLERSLAAQESRDFGGRFDRAIGGLGKDWVPTFGEGDEDEIDADGAEMKNRLRLFEEVRDRNMAAAQRGKRISMPKLVKQALAVVFEKDIKKKANKATRRKLKKRASSAVGKPAGKKGQALTGKERAVEKIAELEAAAEANEV